MAWLLLWKLKLATFWSTHSSNPESTDKLTFFFVLRGIVDYGSGLFFKHCCYFLLLHTL
jgi:hypothetical protein